MKKLFGLVAAMFLLAGCNTIAGIGKDVEAAGSAMEKAATDTKRKL